MTDETMTAEPDTEPAVTIDPGDLVAALMTPWSWEQTETFAARVESRRRLRDERAEAHVLMARTVAENDLPWPSLDLYVYGREDGVRLVACYRADDIDTFRLIARAVRRAIGGLQTKSNEDGSLTATVRSGPVAWDVQLTPESSPCEQVQVGVEVRTTREQIEPARYREVEKEEPVYEWRCPPSVLDPDLLAEAAEVADDELEPEALEDTDENLDG